MQKLALGILALGIMACVLTGCATPKTPASPLERAAAQQGIILPKSLWVQKKRLHLNDTQSLITLRLLADSGTPIAQTFATVGTDDDAPDSLYDTLVKDYLLHPPIQSPTNPSVDIDAY